MSIIAALHHTTHYKYDKPVSLGLQKIRLRPAPHVKADIQSYSLKIKPANHFINWQQDPFGNFLAYILFPDKISEFKIEVDLVTKISVFNPFDFFLEDSAKDFPVNYEKSLTEELAPYLEIKEDQPLLMQWIKEVDVTPRRIVDFLVAINQKLNSTLSYTVRMEPGVQSCEETLKLGSGSCRDMAWLLCQALRHLGLASRFASGYLIQLAADVKSLDGPSGTEVDFTDLHAWTEVFLPGAGWVGLDPTSGLFVGEGHIPLCCTPNPSSASPVSGTIERDTKSTLEHDMTITRMVEEPRVTKPYSAEQWDAMDKLGYQVDAALVNQDVRLTMGGEPTFVSLDDREHNAWHYAALGGNKKDLAKDLSNRLNQHFAPNGLPMYTQGKWYPGEILPRWAIPYMWRKDEQPIWKNRKLLADPDLPLKHTAKTAKTFLKALAETLAIPRSYVKTLREDTPYYLWKDRKLPLQDAMMESDVYEKAERERLQKLMERDLNSAAGFVLPLHYSHRRGRWISNQWKFKSPHIILLTGDSPVGLRLPLGGLPFCEEAALEVCPERSTFATVTDLPQREVLEKIICDRKKPTDDAFKADPNGLIRSALCAEVRNSVLHIFLPPIAWIEHFLELITAIEQVAEKLKIAIVLEGYMPPFDVRLNHLSVTPDPGVIEVNVQPAANWDELKSISNTVYEQARLARLSAEKFLLDGRRVGTGGGNHIVLGAAKPEDSPFLRRPHLLRSMIAFWQNHPSLSYLFAGMYIGPTSQSPRIDEARHDSLYELEIAFQQIPNHVNVPSWLVDRLLRNLLVDVSGNTHRAEFCIDKLYSPDSDRGRLGLLELRGFEMTPHPQMNLLQALLMRAFIAMFWNRPYTGKLIRWGTRLHDRFMLPHYLEEDFDQVLNTLLSAGFSFAKEWFNPFFAFRFPQCGEAQVGEVNLQLSTALEPWPVMGEEPSGGGVSRSVDASVERVQIKTTGLIEGRHVLTCNGRRVPLSKTNQSAVHVAAVRFKAWAQPSSLHPQLPVNSPLIFDVVDIAQNRSLGGCTYYVSHPGGLSHASLPVNENEAEGRKLARFEAMGHTPGWMYIPHAETNSEFPHTLDLRYQG